MENFCLSRVGRQMFLLSGMTFVCLLLPLSNSYYVEISLNKDNGSDNLKVLCGPRTENLEPRSNHRVLWQGSQFGHDEHRRLSEMLPTDVLVPNVSISSSEKYVCYLLARKESSYVFNSQRKRVLRDSLASIPAENGVCRPGYRINADQCFPCFPGSYTSGQDTECFLCPKDFYVSEKGADSCMPCPEGKKTLAQGADSVEACLYFDESGHPLKPETPPWILIYSLIGVILLCVWIVIFIVLIRYFRGIRRQVDAELVERAATRKATADSRSRRPLLRTSTKDDDYESLSDSSDEEEHVYADMEDDYEEPYEIPRKPSDPHVYADLDAPAPPPKTHRPSIKSREQSVDSDGYEIPQKKVSDVEDRRENLKTRSSGAIRSKKSSDQSVRKVKTDEDLNEIPKAKDSEHLYEDIDDDVQHVPAEETHTEESERHASKTRSAGFEPGASSANVFRRTSSAGNARYVPAEEESERHASKTRSAEFDPGDSRVDASRRASSSIKRSNERRKSKNASDERMANIPEETETENNDIPDFYI